MLSVDVAAYAVSEVDDCALRVCRRAWPDAEEWGDVRSICAQTVEDFLIRHPRIKCILLAGGFPCQDLSGANPTGKGVKGSQSS
eukprot:9458879-Karenia_brevis.AAC.1